MFRKMLSTGVCSLLKPFSFVSGSLAGSLLVSGRQDAAGVGALRSEVPERSEVAERL